MPIKKRVLMQVATTEPVDPDIKQAVDRFNKYAADFRNKGKALQSLLDKAKIG